MSGWLLFFTFLALYSCPGGEKAAGGAAMAALVGIRLAWAAVTLGLPAGALRTGGYL
jgi:hypothetical protein